MRPHPVFRAVHQRMSRISRLAPLALSALLLSPASAEQNAAELPAASQVSLRSRIATLLQREGLPVAPIIDDADKDAGSAPTRAQASRATPAQRVPGVQQMAFPTQQRAAGLIVRFRAPEAQAAAARGEAPSAQALAAVQGRVGADAHYQRAMSGGLHVLRFNTPRDTDDAQAIANALEESDEIEWAVPDLIAKPQTMSGDPYFPAQWALHNPARSGFAGIDAEGAWDVSAGSRNVVVAVVDSGIRPHPEFGSRLLPGYDFVSNAWRANDGNGRDADPSDPGDHVSAGECGTGSAAETSSWHGTQVAGIIGADGENGTGIAGIAWRTSILPVRVLGRCGGLASDVLDGMRWSIGLPVPGTPNNPNPARVVNLSLSVEYPGDCYPPFRDVIREATARGALVVAAAGNYDRPTSLYSPANCSQALAVMASAPDGSITSYSNYGSSGLSAPGGDVDRFGAAGGIITTTDTGTRGPANPSYGYAEGTSIAAPHASGIAALALSIAPHLSGEELRSALLYGATPFPADSMCAQTSICGSGIANAAQTLRVAWTMTSFTLVREFYNTDLAHYFRTGAAEEVAFVARGGAGRGWVQTDDGFYAWIAQAPGTVPVCRFYGTPGIGPNSHFYTAQETECAAVKRDRGWTYEGIAFYVKLAVNQRCPANTTPVYRLYNQRWQVNDSNHRYTTNLNVYSTMVRQGWAGEGVAWCAAA